MNPNSQHQRWSKWVFRILPGELKRPTYCDVKHNAAKFGRLKFGMTTVMNVEQQYNRETKKTEWVIMARTEGHPVHDPDFVSFMHQEWTRFALMGFGVGTECKLEQAKLEAGSRQDGSPTDQLIIMDRSLLPNLREEMAKMRREQR